MADTPLGLGLVGCGDIAPRHAEALQTTTNARLVACMDVVESSAKSLGEQFGVPYFARLDDMLALPEVEAVLIATPASTHAALAEQAAKAGKAVICEKPLAASLADADKMIADCKRLGVPLATCHPLRWLKEAQYARELIAAGAIGTVIEIRLTGLGEKKESYWVGGYSGRTRTDWRKSKQASGGGVIITNLIHHLDLARGVTGLEVKRAYTEMGTFLTPVEVEDLGAACLRYDNDAVGVVEGSSCYAGGSGELDMVFLGTKGQSRFGLWSGKCEVFLREPAAGLPANEWIVREFSDQIHVDFYDDFAAAVRNGTTPPVTGEDGRKALEAVLAIYQSAELGRPVSLPL